MAPLMVLLILITFIFSFIYKTNDEKSKKKYLVAVFSFISASAAFRCVSVGVDTIQYAAAYQRIGALSWNNVFKLRYEPGFIVLCKMLNYITDNYQLLIIVSSCFVMFSFAYYIYRKSDDIVLSTVIFLCMIYYDSINGMRQIIAVSILLYGLLCIDEGKYIRFAVLLLLASSFHSSAIMCVLYIPLCKIPFSKLTLPVLPFIMIILVYGHRAILDYIFEIDILRRFEVYIGSKYDVQTGAGGVLKIVVCLGILFFIVAARHMNKQKTNSDYNFNANMVSAWAGVQAVSIYMQILLRLLYYFKFIAVIAIPNALSCFTNNNNKKLMKAAIYALMFMYLFIFSLRSNDLIRAEKYELFTKNNEYSYFVNNVIIY